jgi:redox-sensitive bicupin YhaK (pirin superfamily)
MALTAKESRVPPEIYKSARTTAIQHQGPFTLHFNLPGHNVPGAIDHGYGPLALIVESLLEPGTWIRFHPHKNDEIISWVPDGIMRHNDRTVGELITDKNHLMVMNAGSGFWHEERTLESDPDLRMLQIFVRPHAADLEPVIQHGEISEAPANQWRYLFGPEGSDAPFFVRNDVHFYDIHLDKGAQVEMPEVPAGWHTYFYVFTGKIAIGGESFRAGETGLITSSARMSIDADKESIVVAFVLNPNAKLVRLGTVGR